MRIIRRASRPVAPDTSTFAPAPALARPTLRHPLGCSAWCLQRLYGWCTVLATPVPRRCVVVVYPHTSNWDFVVGLQAKWIVGLHLRWLGKDSLFRTPLAPLFRRWGGIPVNRRASTGITARLAAALAHEADFRIIIAAEGTRGLTAHWKSGFYHLARAADVPVGLAFFDYTRRQVGIGAWLRLTGDVDADMARIAAFYRDKTAKRPELAGPVCLDATAQPHGRPGGSL